MSSKSIDAAIRDRVEAFVGDLTELIREAALEAVREALTGEQPAKRTTRKTAKRKATKRTRRTAEQVENAQAAIIAHVKANPGQRLGDIAKALRLETKDARGPAFALLEAKKLKTTGQRGGTRYFPKGKRGKA